MASPNECSARAYVCVGRRVSARCDCRVPSTLRIYSSGRFRFVLFFFLRRSVAAILADAEGAFGTLFAFKMIPRWNFFFRGRSGGLRFI